MRRDDRNSPRRSASARACAARSRKLAPGAPRRRKELDLTDPIRVLGFAGSLRKASLNRALLAAARELAPDGMTIDIFDIAVVPLYNADVEAAGEPAGVAAFRQAIRGAHGVLMATPEYNHGVPGVMKNAVDWASRPPRAAPLTGKPVGVIGASPGMSGTARGQSQLRQAFEFTNSYCMLQPEVLVFRANEKFDAQGKLTDETTAEFLRKYMIALRDWIARFI
jgi:chromate reductase, NAD(P)H dehydrogenase (quinone)